MFVSLVCVTLSSWSVRTFTVQVAISFNPGLKCQWGQSVRRGEEGGVKVAGGGEER